LELFSLKNELFSLKIEFFGSFFFKNWAFLELSLKIELFWSFCPIQKAFTMIKISFNSVKDKYIRQIF
jgi:hypothetical protein